MRCVRCNRELTEGSRFCEYCGAPQPEPPRGSFCRRCGSEIPAGSRFCARCGAPVEGQGQSVNRDLQGKEPQKDKGKTILIVGIVIAAVLAVAVAVLLVFMLRSRKKDNWEAEERASRYEEEERSREEEEEEAEEPEEEEVPEEAPAEEAPAAEEPAAEEAAPAAEEHDGNYAEVDFGRVSYRPEDRPYEWMSQEEISVLNDEINVVDIPDHVIEGVICLSGENKELDVAVYGDLKGSKPVQVMLLGEDGSGNMDIDIYIYKNQKLAEYTYVKQDKYDEYLEHKIYIYADDCMVFYSDALSSDAQFRFDLGSKPSAVKSQFMEKEAEYYNRGCLIYDIVSEWE